MNDTIVAVATSLGVGAISIIRLSGKESVLIANSIFKGKDLTKVDTHTIHYGFIVDNDMEIDEVLVNVMISPKTYTTEDTVEINCHGGISTTNRILELLVEKGARLAEPGEFTKRAFLNGRIDLIEAESVSDLISSKSDKQRTMAINGVNGRITKIVRELKDKILNIIANIEVNIDYPEYEDAIEVTPDYLKTQLVSIEKEMELLLSNSEIDTAGIRETTDVVEKIGVDKSKQIINQADLVVLVLNNNEELTNEDKSLLKITQEKENIIFVNKTDLENKLQLPENVNVVKGNTKDLDGLEELKKKIIEMYNLDKIAEKDLTYLSNVRQITLVKEALESIKKAIADAEGSIPVDMLEIHLRNAFDNLGILIGEKYEDELIDKLFKNFCLGK